MAIAKYKKQTFEYKEEHLDINNLPEITKDDAKEVLFKTQDILKEYGIDVYLGFGTLLGAVREKDFIEGDLDVDVYIKDEKRLFDNLKNIEDKGLSLVRHIKRTYSFRYNNNPKCYIDVYICSPTYTIWGLYCYKLVLRMVPKKFLQDGNIVFLDRKFMCPKNPEKILKFWYTETWNVPIGKFDKEYKYDVPSHYYYTKAIQTIKRIIKRIIGDKFFNKIKVLINGGNQE